MVDAALVVDADTGFGNAVNVTHAVRRLERAGADAIQLEDQVMPKKCGHFAGKAVIDADEMELKLRAALDARRSDDTLIIARTDARATHGLEAALERAERYRAAGADVIFVEAPTSTDELRAVAAAIDAPLVANMVEGGTTPLLDLEALGTLGYAIVLYANAALRCAQRAVTRRVRRAARDRLERRADRRDGHLGGAPGRGRQAGVRRARGEVRDTMSDLRLAAAPSSSRTARSARTSSSTTAGSPASSPPAPPRRRPRRST